MPQARVLSIPLTNFAGWFLLIFLFALVFDRLPDMRRRLGPAGAAGRFLLLLAGLEAAFLVYGGLARLPAGGGNWSLKFRLRRAATSLFIYPDLARF